MAVAIAQGAEQFQHACPLPWPVDPDVPEGHVCECGRRWVYQPAHWDPLLTLDALRARQEAGAYRRGIVPTFQPRTEVEHESAVIVPIRP